jgi:hypothetical protein
MRFIGSAGRAFLLTLSLLAITPGPVFPEGSSPDKAKPKTAAPESGFSALLLEAEGTVIVINKATNTATAAAEGVKVYPGDLVQTKADSAVDILYEDGNVTAIDENTIIEIKALSINKDQITSVIKLTKGRIRNSITKVMNTRMKFEVHTRSGVAGVTGTPPWLVNIVTGPDGTETAEIDLLTKEGDAGGVFFQGTDKDATKVTLSPGTRTTATKGSPPAPPKKIEPARLTMLEKAVPVRVKPEIREQKRNTFMEMIAATIGAIKAKEKEKKPEAKPEEKPKPKVELKAKPKAKPKTEPKAEPKPPAIKKPKAKEVKQKSKSEPAETVKQKPKAEEKQKEKASKKKSKSKKKKKKRAKKKSGDDDMQDMFKRSRRKIDDKF